MRKREREREREREICSTVCSVVSQTFKITVQAKNRDGLSYLKTVTLALKNIQDIIMAMVENWLKKKTSKNTRTKLK